MDKSFHYTLMANQALVQKRIIEKLKDTNLTIGQPKVLDFLKEQDGISQKDIAKGCMIEQASLTSILHRMEDLGMIERKMINGNRRSLYVYLTEYGRELALKVDNAFKEIESNAFAGISEEEIKQFMKIFLKIEGNLLGREE